jgi:leucyl aminopeptidase
MSVTLRKPPSGATPIHLTDRASLAGIAAGLPEPTRRWLGATGFTGAPDAFVLVPDERGNLREVWAGVGSAAHPWALAALPRALPAGRYRLGDRGLPADAHAAAMSWSLGGYAFESYRGTRRTPAELLLAPSAAAAEGLRIAEAIAHARDLINTPAEDLGPAELGDAVRALAQAHGGRFREIVGDKLPAAGFPAIHAVGRAASRAPRLLELTWGDPKARRLTLVGKGVCFDSGGLDIKPPDAMRQMKKDMGGAAAAIALARLAMAEQLPVRLQLLIPAVENAIAGNAYRPGDVIRTRKGLQVEIGNTDAEGRVILSDALAFGAESRPELMIDLATLTGAARIALGPQLPALFCRQMAMARDIVDRSLALEDPVWHMPLWPDYRRGIESEIGDIVNTGRNAMGGAIAAALFLDHFVPESVDWLHLDVFGWNDTPRPGRPVGGEAQAVRTLLAVLRSRFAGDQSLPGATGEGSRRSTA